MATKPKIPPKAGAAVPKKQEPQPKPGTDVALKGDDALILQGDKHDLSHLQTKTSRGNENVGTEDMVIPRLEVVQSQSMCLKTGTPEYIDGAKAGDLINSVSRKNYGCEVFVVNCFYAKLWLVWKSYDEGGGFFGAFPNSIDAEARMKEVIAGGEKKEHIEVIDTPQHLCLLVDPHERSIDEVMLSLAKTKAGVSREWNTMIRMAGGDRFSRVYRVSTAQETNKKNQTYWNYVVAQCGAPAIPLFQRAEKLFTSVSSGARKVVMDMENLRGAGEPDGPSEM